MALADLTAFKTELARAQRYPRFKDVGSNITVTFWNSEWKSAQDAAANPSGTAANNLGATTTGSIIGVDPPAAGVARLAQIEGVSQQNGVILVCDRLAHIGALSGIVTTEQTVAIGPNSSRETTGAGVMLGLEIGTIIGTTATTVTARYTNQAGTASRTTAAVAIGGSNFREVGRFICLPLQEGDTGVRSVEGLTLAATTGTAGAIAVVLYKPMVLLSLPGKGSPFLWDGLNGGGGNLPDVTNRCLFTLAAWTGTAAGRMLEMRVIDT